MAHTALVVVLLVMAVSVKLVRSQGANPLDTVQCRDNQFCEGTPVAMTRQACCVSTDIRFTIEGDEGCFQCPRPADSQEMVRCATLQNCGDASTEMVTREACCMHNTAPSGIAYSFGGSCNLCPLVFGFNQTTISGFEQGVTYVVEVGVQSGQFPDVIFGIVDLILMGTTASSDIVVLSETVSIFPRSTMPSLISFIFQVDGVAQEFEEQFMLRVNLTTLTGSNFDEFRDTLIGTIMDSDVADFGLSENDYRANEFQPSIPVRISKTSGITLANPVQMKITPMTVESALAMGIITVDIVGNESRKNPNRANEQDFDTSVLMTTFGADEAPLPAIQDIDTPVSIVNDLIDEAEQNFIVYFEVIGAVNNNSFVVNRNFAICRIADDDPISIGFQFPEYTFFEPEFVTPILNVTLIKEDNRVTEQTLNVIVTYASDSADLDIDYTLGALPGVNSQEREILPNVQNSSISFFLLADQFPEGTEIFRIISSAQVNTTTIDPSNTFTSATIFILDNDIALVGFESPTYTVNETDGTVEVCIVVTNPPNNTNLIFNIITLHVTRSNTADSSMDYTEITAEQFPLTSFPEGTLSRRECFDVTINDDDTHENDESFFLDLSLDTLFGAQDGTRITLNSTEITIIDDDAITVSIQEPNYRVIENERFVEVCVVLSGPADEPITIRGIARESMPADARDMADFIARSPDFVFLPEATISCANITIVDDEISEPTVEEIFIVTIELPPTSDLDLELGPDPESTVIIVDDDTVTIGFKKLVYESSENDTAVQEVCAIVIGDVTLGRTVEVTLRSMDGTAQAPGDYNAQVVALTFDAVNSRRCALFNIPVDRLVEGTENFTASLETSDVMVDLVPSRTTVEIRDSVPVDTTILVNDTVIGDPLFTVPILVSEEQLLMLNVPKLSLCYEIHGEGGHWFNFITDQCTTVNAQYFALSPRLNVVDRIGVRTVDDNGECVNILVDVDQCAASVNDASLDLMDRYSSGGVNVRRYSNRVRISVPNCNDLTLVMWVICDRRIVDNPDEPGTTTTADMIKFVVMRGLNTGHSNAHGLIGQFWNVPVDITPYTGLSSDGTVATGRYIVGITTSGVSRSYTGWFYALTWDTKDGPCLYVGNGQAGDIQEVDSPNEGVIEDIYKDYRVPSAFSEENFKFSSFDEERCPIATDVPPSNVPV